MIRRTEAELEKIRELRERYENEGFVVVADPGEDDVPFDLYGFRPDLLVHRKNEHFLVKVRTLGARVPVDRVMEVSREVKRRPGWRFYIVTADDVDDDAPGIADPLPSWPELSARAAEAVHVSQTLGNRDFAVLVLWPTTEAILRKLAEEAAIPVERLPVNRVVPQLYSMGELTFEQYEALRDALEVRKRLMHGYTMNPADVTLAERNLVKVLSGFRPEPLERAA